MKLILTVVFSFTLATFSFAQVESLPEILRPGHDARAEADRSGTQVFRILPRGMFKDPPNSLKDADNPLGIREGGAFYSFTSGKHSYNNTPQIMLEQGNLMTGFAGADYGMIADIGYSPLSDLDPSIPELVFMTSYRPPKYEKEIRAESFHNRRIDGVLYRRSVPAIQGHTYLLRTIRFDQTDILVAFRIFKIEEDGSMSIIWKKLADFGKPIMLYMSDADLKAAVHKIISDSGIDLGAPIDIKDNILIITGRHDNSEWRRFQDAYRFAGIRFRGVSFQSK